jgi:hypothetical protein
MQNVRKVVITPFEAEKVASPDQYGGAGEDDGDVPTVGRKQQKRVIDKLMRQFKVILKLAKIDGYDAIGRIKGLNGEYMDNTDIIALLINAMTPGRVLKGQERFIELLREAKVEPELIMNDNVRYKLLKPLPAAQQNIDTQTEPQHEILPVPESMVTGEETVVEPNKRPLKRPHGSLFSEPVAKRRWTEPEDSE